MTAYYCARLRGNQIVPPPIHPVRPLARMPDAIDLESSHASGIGVSVGAPSLHAGMPARGQRYVSAVLPPTGLSVRQYSPVNNAPRLSFWPLAIAAAILAVLLAVAVR